MIESTWWLVGGLASVLLAALGFIVVGQPWRKHSPFRAAAAYAVAVFLGFAGATFLHRLVKHDAPWPPREAADYILVAIAPAALLVQLVGAIGKVPRRVVWSLRVVLVGVAVPLVLKAVIQNAWTPQQAALCCIGLGLPLMAVWALLAALGHRGAGRGSWWTMLIITLGAGATMLASDAASIGEMGLSLGGAVLGAGLAGLTLRGPARLATGLGFAYLLLAVLLLDSRFYAALTTPHAIVLAIAPLLAWIVAIPQLRRHRWLPALVALAVTAAVIAAVALPALVKAAHDATAVDQGGE